jgi:hypothetical protein
MAVPPPVAQSAAAFQLAFVPGTVELSHGLCNGQDIHSRLDIRHDRLRRPVNERARNLQRHAWLWILDTPHCINGGSCGRLGHAAPVDD